MAKRRVAIDSQEGLVAELTYILYLLDPDQVGISVLAPDDEYEDEAGRLVVALGEKQPRHEIAQIVRKFWPEADRRLVLAVQDAWDRYVDKASG